MGTFERRSILRLFGGVAVAAPRAAHFATAAADGALGTGSALGAGLGQALVSAPFPGSGGGYAVSSNPIMWAAQQAFVRADRRQDQRRARRIGGLDPDLAVLGSTSVTWRALIQERRDRRERGALQKLRSVVFQGDPDNQQSIYDAFSPDD